MANNMIALQARAPRMISYNELVAGRDQQLARQNALDIQQQTMQQNAATRAKAAQSEAAMKQALAMAQRGDIAGAQEQFGLGAGNIDVYNTLSKIQGDQLTKLQNKLTAVAAPAIEALNTPDPAARAAIFQSALPQLTAQGWTPEEVAKFPLGDADLKRAIANAQSPADAIKAYAKDQEAYTLTPGAARFRGGSKIAEQPAVTPQGVIKEIIGEDGQPQYVRIVDGVAQPVGLGEPSGGLVGGPRGGAASALATNPGALKDGPFARGQRGYTGSSGGFATFDTPENGARAQENLLRSAYVGKGFNTIDKIVNRYAPQGAENSAASVANYKKYIADRTGLDVNAPISAGQVSAVAAAMREFETGNRPGGKGSAVRPVPSAGAIKAKEKQAETHRVAGAIGNKIDNQIANIDGLLNAKGLDTITGNIQGNIPGALMSVASQDAANALAKYKTIVANATLTELQELKATSPTGGALGAVSDAENQMLRDAAATLDRAQDLETFKTALRDYKTKLERAKARLLGAYEEDFGQSYQSYSGGSAPRRTPTGGGIPAGAIQKLRSDPSLRGAFDAKYGAGAAAKVLGGR